jgi:hypothetical protein
MTMQEAQRHMAYYGANSEKIAKILYFDAILRGYEEPTIFVLDPWDQLAQRIAETLGENDKIASLAARDPHRSASRALVCLVPRSKAAAIFADESLKASALVAAETRHFGGCPVVVVTRGGQLCSISLRSSSRMTRSGRYSKSSPDSAEGDRAMRVPPDHRFSRVGSGHSSRRTIPTVAKRVVIPATIRDGSDPSGVPSAPLRTIPPNVDRSEKLKRLALHSSKE